MPTNAVGYTAPKAGRTADENEDAFHAPELGGTRFAIADGATESSYSGAWAKLVVKAAAIGRRHADGYLSLLASIQAEWRRDIPEELPWYATEKVEQGAFTAFLLLKIGPSPNWSARSIGDCCLFQVRAGRLVTRWPYTHPSQFDNHPFLLGSRSTYESLKGHIDQADGQWEAGDEFWLATDALAHWLLTQHLAGKWPPVSRADVGDAGGFHAWVEARRREGLRNDDTTLVRVTLS